MKTEQLHIGTPLVRWDSCDKAAGKVQFLGDMTFPDMQYAKTVRSTVPRARIISIKLPDLPLGYFTVGWQDIPGLKAIPFPREPYPIFAHDTVNFIGEPILLLVGPKREMVYQLASLVEIQYSELDAVFDLDVVGAANCPIIHNEDNVLCRQTLERGEIAPAFENAWEVFEEEFNTGYQAHLYLETLRIVAVPEGDRMTLYGPVQGPNALITFLSLSLSMSADRFRVVTTTIGGGFGGKIEFPLLLACQAGCAVLKTGKPVQILYDRAEDTAVTTKRHPSRIRFKTALNSNRQISAMEIDMMLAGGAYPWFCSLILNSMMAMCTGVYDLPALKVNGQVMASNRLMPGAMRGFGVAQATFAIETHFRHIALKIAESPLAFKQRHMLTQNSFTTTGGIFRDKVPIADMLKKALEASGYMSKIKEYQNSTGRKRRGIGLSLYLFGAPHTMGPDAMPRYVSLVKEIDDTVSILTTVVDLGQGIDHTYRKIVAETLELPIEQVIYRPPDTDTHPNTMGTGASLSVVLFGKSFQRAAEKMKERWSEPGPLTITENFVEPAYLRYDKQKMIGDSFHTYSWGVLVAEVEVDTLTAQTELTNLWAIHDIGTPIDNILARGQVEGGIVQGLGYTLMEVLESDKGRLLQTHLRDYIIPTSQEVPKIEGTFYLDNPYPEGPFGAKSAGEMPFVGVAPAIVDAIENAVNVRIQTIPVTSERLLQLMEQRSVRGEPVEP